MRWLRRPHPASTCPALAPGAQPGHPRSNLGPAGGSGTLKTWTCMQQWHAQKLGPGKVPGWHSYFPLRICTTHAYALSCTHPCAAHTLCLTPSLCCPQHALCPTCGPTSVTLPTPSCPGTPGRAGCRGYLPWQVLMSEGLMGACRTGYWAARHQSPRDGAEAPLTCHLDWGPMMFSQCWRVALLVFSLVSVLH